MKYLLYWVVSGGIIIVATIVYFLVLQRYRSTRLRIMMYWGIVLFFATIVAAQGFQLYIFENRDKGFPSIGDAVAYYENVPQEKIFAQIDGSESAYVAYYNDDGGFSSCLLRKQNDRYIKCWQNQQDQQHGDISIFYIGNKAIRDMYVLVIKIDWNGEADKDLTITDNLHSDFKRLEYNQKNILYYIAIIPPDCKDYTINVEGITFEKG